MYRLCSVLLHRFGDSIRAIGTDFGESVTAAMDGEKDPRNLMLTFRLVVELVHSGIEAAEGELAEELFDVIVDSSEEGVRKPDVRIFDRTLERLEVEAHRAIFLDDYEVNDGDVVHLVVGSDDVAEGDG